MNLESIKSKFEAEQQGRVREALHCQYHFQSVAGKLFAARLQARKFPGQGWEEKISILEK